MYMIPRQDANFILNTLTWKIQQAGFSVVGENGVVTLKERGSELVEYQIISGQRNALELIVLITIRDKRFQDFQTGLVTFVPIDNSNWFEIVQLHAEGMISTVRQRHK